MASVPNVTIKATETGISVIADSGFNEVWCGDNCLGYVKGPGERSFPLKKGKYEIVVYCSGIISVRQNVVIVGDKQHETQSENALSVERLTSLKNILTETIKEIDKAISEK